MTEKTNTVEKSEVGQDMGKVITPAKKVKKAVKTAQVMTKIAVFTSPVTSIMTRNITDFLNHIKTFSPDMAQACESLYHAMGGKDCFLTKENARLELSLQGKYLLYHPLGGNKALQGERS